MVKVQVKALENWELMQKFATQHEKAHEMNARYSQKVHDADAEIKEATVKYEMLLRKEFEGEDVAAAKQKALEDIEKAKAAYEVAQEESGKAYKYSNEYLHGKITIQDIINDFNQNIAPQIKKEDVFPLYEQAENALYDYYDALAKIYSIAEEVRPTIDWLDEIKRGQKGPMSVIHNPAKGSNMYLPRPTNQILQDVERYRFVPKGYNGLTEEQEWKNGMAKLKEEAAAAATKQSTKKAAK
ncbi:hypothetical protein [Bacillus nitratireducens]|uniref:hypothetical protein n=1 Tax=Bacillus nitratireducens TaxID=2026193 RepID=UPI002E22BDDF|nr:hypothetical protein [Bacillus nitratireducens]